MPAQVLAPRCPLHRLTWTLEGFSPRQTLLPRIDAGPYRVIADQLNECRFDRWREQIWGILDIDMRRGMRLIRILPPGLLGVFPLPRWHWIRLRPQALAGSPRQLFHVPKTLIFGCHRS